MPESKTPTALQSLSDDLTSAVARAEGAIVAIHARRRIPSTGVLWRRGVVVAAHHTIHREEGIRVTLAGGETTTATLIGRDPTTDLAALRLEGGGGKGEAADVVAGSDFRVGQFALALGKPGPDVTASIGIVSAVGGEWRTLQGGRIDHFVRLDVAIYDGFSGGPLVDARGRVLGINSSAFARAAAVTIPASTVNRVLEQLLATGHVPRGWLGLGMQPVRLPPDLTRAFGLSREIGLMVVSVGADGPAQRAGVLLGDVIVDFDGTPVSDPSELLAHLSGERIGTSVNVRLIRAGEIKSVSLKIGERTAR
jgi:S1-C subfamily serine protease